MGRRVRSSTSANIKRPGISAVKDELERRFRVAKRFVAPQLEYLLSRLKYFITMVIHIPTIELKMPTWRLPNVVECNVVLIGGP